jgi:hypothetical protein
METMTWETLADPSVTRCASRLADVWPARGDQSRRAQVTVNVPVMLACGSQTYL